MKDKTVLTELEKRNRRSDNMITLFGLFWRQITKPFRQFVWLCFLILVLLPFGIPNMLYERFKFDSVNVKGIDVNLGIAIAAGVFAVECLLGVAAFLYIRRLRRKVEMEIERKELMEMELDGNDSWLW